MFLSLSGSDFLSVAIASVATFVLGGIWFTQVVDRIYLVALGRVATPNQKPAPIVIIGPLVCNLVAILTSALLIRMLRIESIAGALGLGALVGVGYVLSTCMNVAINPNFPRPFLYTLINAPYFIGASLISCVIIVAVH